MIVFDCFRSKYRQISSTISADRTRFKFVCVDVLFFRVMYLLGYIPKDNRLYLSDKDLNVVSYSLLLSVLEYQTAVMREDFETAKQVLVFFSSGIILQAIWCNFYFQHFFFCLVSVIVLDRIVVNSPGVYSNICICLYIYW